MTKGRALSRDTRKILVVAAVLLAVGAASALSKPFLNGRDAQAIAVDAVPIAAFGRFAERDPQQGRAVFRGGLILTSPSTYFGGWSALITDDDAKGFLALSDAGLWMTGRLVYSGTTLSGVKGAQIGPLLGRDGNAIRRSRDRDSESVALEHGTLGDGTVLIGFEEHHRIERYKLTSNGVTSDLGPIPIPAAAKKMRGGQGFEAMTVLKGGPYKGSVIAFSERLLDLSRNHTGWLWTKNGPETIHLTNIDDYDVTDLSSLDDGTLFILERRFRWLEGVKMRLRRLAPEDVKPGMTAKGETLIEADLNDQIDNMEGLAATRLKSGEVLVTMISDDNYNHILQRNMLLQFTIDDGKQAKARAAGLAAPGLKNQ